MPTNSRDSNREMEYLTRTLPVVKAANLTSGLLAASRFTRTTPGHGMTEQHKQEDAFLLSFQVHDYRGKMWVDGSEVDFAGSRGGNFTFYDYSRDWRADLQSAFDCVNFYIPRVALSSLEEEFGAKRLGDFSIMPGTDVHDPIVAGIVGALLPVFDGRYETNQLLLDYVGTGLLVHLASNYAGLSKKGTFIRGGLTSRQLNQAMDLMSNNLRGDLTLDALARACGLSASYFARAFKASTGLTPHQWLADQRLKTAVELLKNSSMPLHEVARTCGYADQAHFTRSFSQKKGMPPSVWRRARQRSVYSLHHIAHD